MRGWCGHQDQALLYCFTEAVDDSFVSCPALFSLAAEEDPQGEPGPGDRLQVSKAKVNHPVGLGSKHFRHCSDSPSECFTLLSHYVSNGVRQGPVRINEDGHLFFSNEASDQFDPLPALLFKKLNFTI